MPHVIVKMSPGRSEDQKRRLAEAFAKDLIEITGAPAGFHANQMNLEVRGEVEQLCP